MNPDTPLPPLPETLKENLFSQKSRYNGIELLQTSLPDGRLVTYVERRFLPPHESLEVFDYHLVVQGDRIDNIAAHYLGDPEFFFRICDGNYELDPTQLTTNAATRLNITLPPSSPGSNDV